MFKGKNRKGQKSLCEIKNKNIKDSLLNSKERRKGGSESEQALEFRDNNKK